MDSPASPNPMMQRQEALNLSIPQSVAVIGAGGVGSWTAYLLALAGVPKIYLFDSDLVSDSNLNRIPLPVSMVGIPKSQAIASLIRMVRPACNVVALGHFSPGVAQAIRLNSTNLAWVIATTDTLSSRQMVQKWASANYISYAEAAAEGDTGSVTGQAASWATPEESLPGYASVPVWAVPCIQAASLVVSYVCHDVAVGDRVVRIGWERFHVSTASGVTFYDSYEESNGLEPDPAYLEDAPDPDALGALQHINGDRTDNRISNLRIVAVPENAVDVWYPEPDEEPDYQGIPF